MKAVLIIVISFLLLAACNPMRRIDMLNRSGSDMKITWKLKERDSIYTSPFFYSGSDEVEFKLKPEAPYNTVKMTFGVGRWSRDTLRVISDQLESLEIESGRGKILLNTPDDIYNYLVQRRKGIGNRKIQILVKD